MERWKRYKAKGGVFIKRENNLFDKLISDENLKTAIDEVNRTHRWRAWYRKNKTVAKIDANKDLYIQKLREIIVNGYEPSPFKTSQRWDKSAMKYRIISEPKLWPDQYIHHAVIQVLQPVLMRGMDRYCCGSIPGRGTHYGKKQIEKWLKNDIKNTKYCLEMDIKHFYDNIQVQIVMKKLKRLVKDYRILDICERMMKPGVLIGAYYSQWFANLILQDLDQYIRQQDGVAHYCRYMDNFTIFGPNKKQLHKVRVCVALWLEQHGLKLKENWQVYPVNKRRPSAMGFVYGRGYTLPRKKNKLKLVRSIKKCERKIKDGKTISIHLACATISRLGQMTHCNHKNFYEKVLPKGLIRTLKSVISNHQKQVNIFRKEIYNE